MIGSKNISYVVTISLDPYFTTRLLQTLGTSSAIAVCFDEALNKISQRGKNESYFLLLE